MKLAFLYGNFSLGNRPFDFENLYTAPRGLTGSELSCLEYALSMRDRGHDVMLVVGQPIEPFTWRGIEVRPARDPRITDGMDAVLSWNEPDMLRDVAPGIFRLVNQQLNDFAYCIPGWEEFVDITTSPSAHHLEFLKKQAPSVRAWDVLPNGCNPEMYEEGHRVPGRVIWASSADRGLHRLLEAWPRIKARVPNASLRCFYNFQPADFDEYEVIGPNVHPDLLEIAQRKRYIQYAAARLSDPKWDVEHVGSVGRGRMRMEFEHAVVLGYAADTIRYTEGFSVTSMEACASGCLPVLTDIDSLGHIYGEAAPMVRLEGKTFGGEHLDEFVELVVRGLTDEAWRAENVAKARELAARHAWPVLAEQLEGILTRGIIMKSSASPSSVPATAEEEPQTTAPATAAASFPNGFHIRGKKKKKNRQASSDQTPAGRVIR